MLATATGSGLSDFVTERSACGFTTVFWLMLLFRLLESSSVAVTLAVLVIVVPPAATVGVALIMTAATAPLSRAPKLHVTVPEVSLQLPWLGVAAPIGSRWTAACLS